MRRCIHVYFICCIYAFIRYHIHAYIIRVYMDMPDSFMDMLDGVFMYILNLVFMHILDVVLMHI